MCVAFFALDSLAGYRLVLASNRDEFYKRPSSPLHLWQNTNLFAGQDTEKGGSWLGCTQEGRWAIITNFRDPKEFGRSALSRGQLVRNFLLSEQSPKDFLQTALSEIHNYNGFNLIAGDLDVCFYLSNRKNNLEALSPGVYGLSNALLDSPWPKVQKGKTMFQKIINQNPKDIEAYFSLLTDQSQAPDSKLPNTGIPLEKERLLSSLFIRSSVYGTKSSTILFIEDSGKIEMIERVWNIPSKKHPPDYSETTMSFP